MNIGDKRGKLTVERLYTRRTAAGKAERRVVAQCACGGNIDTRLDAVRGGKTKSCGCLRVERMAKLNYLHGQSATPLFQVWQHMFERCETKRYKARGIRVCNEWQDFAAFKQYVDAALGEKPAGFSIDRKDNEKNYAPENVRWASPSRQQRNKTNTNWVTAFGQTKCVVDWAEEYKISPHAVRQRLRRKWSPEEALTGKRKK